MPTTLRGEAAKDRPGEAQASGNLSAKMASAYYVVEGLNYSLSGRAGGTLFHYPQTVEGLADSIFPTRHVAISFYGNHEEIVQSNARTRSFVFYHGQLLYFETLHIATASAVRDESPPI
jgi:hypothetical protein